ncbi:MAG: proton-conducting membrane transporter [Clostridia bacterium]|nr:proton-conducting membrane transporter [Clostridia bacterium]
MMQSLWWIIVVIFLPVIGGVAIPLLNFRVRKAREMYIMALVLTTSLLTVFLLLAKPEGALSLISLSNSIDIGFYVDGLGSVFALLIALLWPIATSYAFEYMSHEHRENTFFTYYTITFGITLGIAFSANLITMYLFCEILTLITLPLIMHEQTKEANVAGIKYIVYFMAGATAAFVGIIIFHVNGGGFAFIPGGLASQGDMGETSIYFSAFLLMFFGFGVKAAIFPFHDWLPSAGVAPTPVTALLHAVAVVKSGVFAIIRLTYFSFGTEILRGSWAIKIALAFSIFTIVFGAIMAWKEIHFKKRLAYSTISNLSYMLFAALLLTPDGLVGGLMHMLFHGVMKITLFFVAGAVICQSGVYYVTELKGFGKRMPVTFFTFVIASLALTGVVPLCGFVSKWYLAEAAVQAGGAFAYAGLAAILFAAVFTAIYLFTVVVRAYFPSGEYDQEALKKVKDPGVYILAPLVLLAVSMLLLGVFSSPLAIILNQVAFSAF